jgi:hypothetical protein
MIYGSPECVVDDEGNFYNPGIGTGPAADTFVVSLANGGCGYLPTPEQHRFGGYETWLTTNKVQEDASVILVDNLLEMLGELFPSSR